MVSRVALLNTHPFPDGNGRFARSVFNWILREHVGQGVYLPIKEVALLRVREAEHFHEWQPLAEFLLMISRKLFRAQ